MKKQNKMNRVVGELIIRAGNATIAGSSVFGMFEPALPEQFRKKKK